jgi:hypothetical protein
MNRFKKDGIKVHDARESIRESFASFRNLENVRKSYITILIFLQEL